LQGRKTLPHFFLGADSVPAFGLAAVPVALLETLGLAADLTGDFGKLGPGVTIGTLAVGAADGGVGVPAAAGERVGVGAGVGIGVGVGVGVGIGVGVGVGVGIGVGVGVGVGADTGTLATAVSAAGSSV